MRISTIRSLLVLLDVCLFLGVGGVVYMGMGQKATRASEHVGFKQRVLAALEDVKPERAEPRKKADLSQVRGFLFDGRLPPQAKPDKPVEVKPRAKTYRPLDTLLVVVGAEMHGARVGVPGFVLYQRLGEAPLAGAASPAATRREVGSRPGGRPAVRRPGTPNTRAAPASSGGSNRTVYSASVGDAIEFSEHEVAVVNGVRPFEKDGQVLHYEAMFDYGEKVVPVKVTGTPGGSKAPVAATPKGPISSDPGTWVTWNQSKPHEIQVTEMGVRAFERDGEKVLEGVRWSTERLPGGQKAIKVAHIPPNGALAKGGARAGDVIESINGTPVSSKSEIVRYVRANPNLPKYTVTFWRGGRRVSRTVNRPQNAGQ